MDRIQNRGGKRLKEWLPVVGLTLAAFVFNTSEYIPIGLLTDIATDFQTTEAHAGLLITVYAWVVAIASLPLMLMVSRVENRRLLLSVLVLFIGSHLISSFSSGYSMLMASRIGVACSHAIFWSIVTPLAVRVAPEGFRSVAISLIATGTSIAMIVGLPLGRTIGLHVGWRMTFFYVAVAACVVMLLLGLIFPKVPSRNSVSLQKLPALLKAPVLLAVYILTVIAITAHFTSYSYIEPFLGQVAGLEDAQITWVLTAFGLIGILGSVLFSRYYDRHPFTFVRLGVFGLAAFLLLLRPAACHAYSVIALCLCWGLAITIFNLTFQSEIIQVAPQATAIAMSVYSGIYNVGIGSGALIGGVICTHLSIAEVGYVGGAIALVACFYCARKLVPLLQKYKKQIGITQ